MRNSLFFITVGVAPASATRISVGPTPINFGQHEIGTDTNGVVFINYSGTQDLASVDAIALLPTVGSPNFSVDLGDAPLPIELFSGARFGFLASFSPLSVGIFEANVLVHCASCSIVQDHFVTLTGEGMSSVPVPAAVWVFGSALLGLGVVKRKKA